MLHTCYAEESPSSHNLVVFVLEEKITLGSSDTDGFEIVPMGLE